MEKRNSLLRKAYRHWYDDGLGEITQGTLFLLIALYFSLQQLLRANRTMTIILSVVMPLTLVGLVISMRRMVNRLKERITYPRAGFVSYRQDRVRQRRRRTIRIVLGLAMGLSVGILGVGLRSSSVAWSYVLMGIAFMAIYIYTGWRVGIVRFYVTAGIGLIAGVILGVLSIPDGVGMAIFFASIGLPSLVIGLVELKRFQRANPLIGLDTIGDETDDPD